MAAVVDLHFDAVRDRLSVNACDERVLLRPSSPDADFARFARYPCGANIYVVATGSEVGAGLEAEASVVRAGGIASERCISARDVVVAAGVAMERVKTVGRVRVPGVVEERLKASRRVKVACCIAIKRLNAVGCVPGAGGAVEER